MKHVTGQVRFHFLSSRLLELKTCGFDVSTLTERVPQFLVEPLPPINRKLQNFALNMKHLEQMHDYVRFPDWGTSTSSPRNSFR